MILTFRHKGLKELFEKGRSAKVPAELRERCVDMLDVLNEAITLSECNGPGFELHPLHQFKPIRYSVKVSGPWRITFEWSTPNILRLDLEQYH